MTQLFVDRSDPRPLTRQVYDQLRAAIVQGRLAPGDQLTPTRAAAADLGVARSTVAEATAASSRKGTSRAAAGAGAW